MRRSALIPIIILLACGTCHAADLARDAWMGVYLGPNRIGSVHTTVTRDRLLGREVWRMREVLTTRFRMEGRAVRSESSTMLFFGDDLKPIEASYRQTDNGATTWTTARFRPDKIECQRCVRYKISPKIIPIRPRTDFSAWLAYELGLRIPAKGEELAAASFDPSRMVVATETYRRVGKEQVTYLGTQREAIVIRHGSGRMEVNDWRLDGGELAMSEVPGIGARIIAEAKPLADWGVNDVGPDLDVVPVDKPIPDPRHARTLTIRLIGELGTDLVLNDSRQRAESSGKTVTYHIVADPFDPTKSPKLLIKSPGLAAFLRPSEGIESQDPGIAKQAREIVGKETSAYKVACKLREWVQTHVQPSTDAATPLSAVGILKQRTGCCRHNSVLYAALARSVGISTRLAGGLIYDSGAFRFHVWNESWVGQWVGIDPTYPGDFVDATHIKLVEGGVGDLPSLGRVVGRLRVEILD